MIRPGLSTLLVAAFSAWAALPCPADEPPAAEHVAAAKSFDEQIAPLLARRCLECHNASDRKGELDLTRVETALAGGDSGPAIVPGTPAESNLWQRVADDEMPPKKPLDAAEKQLLRDWIAQGAKWGQSPVDRFRHTSDVRAGYDWWSLVPVRRPDLPAVRRADWARNPIDRFVLARLEAEGLAPSDEADRRTLIRRLAFDLTGLPPSPEEIAAFVADPDPRAYEAAVDRLLASPDYGERWARHWLDLARFGESNGFEYDEPRRNAWPYRDWVVGALNRDLPFDEFARLQLAGDVLRPGDEDAIKATGFLAAAAFDTVGQNQQSQAMKAVVRQDELEDLVSTSCQTFLALTVHCARCHDHKFDPIRQTEYYQLTSALDGVRQGERDVTSAEERAEIVKRTAEMRAQIVELTASIRRIEDPPRLQILAERNAQSGPRPAPPTPLARWTFDEDLRDSVGALHGAASGRAVVRDGQLRLDGRKTFVATEPLATNLQAKTLEAWVTLDNLGQAGGGVMGIQTLDGSAFDAIVFAERQPGRWMAGSDNFSRTQDFDGAAETSADKGPVHVAIVYDADGTVSAYRGGQPYGKPYRGPAPYSFAAGKAQVTFGLRHAPAGGNRMLAGTIDRAQLYDRALTPDEIAASAEVPSDFVNEATLVARLGANERAERERLKQSLEHLRAQVAKPAKKLCYAVAPRQPAPARLLVRGDSRQPGEVVAPGGLSAAVGLSADFHLPPDAPEGERRAALARWITSPQNPLFARVIVNRLWHYHFGMGLVDTPSDFGFSGGRPSHPELLAWLATYLVNERFSLKQLHRTIVLSATYRQASRSNPAAAARDADNRWLWRKTPLRLDAESVRDAVLTVAGELNPARGGPGFHDCQEVLRSGTYSYVPSDPEGIDFQRRSIYRVWTRGGRSNLLDVFDCPDPSTTSPKRAVTTTPLQALALLNNSFVLRMAERLAERIQREAGADSAAQVARAYQLAYGRAPTADEVREAQQVVERHGLSVLARAIYNSNEFLYVD